LPVTLNLEALTDQEKKTSIHITQKTEEGLKEHSLLSNNLNITITEQYKQRAKQIYNWFLRRNQNSLVSNLLSMPPSKGKTVSLEPSSSNRVINKSTSFNRLIKNQLKSKNLIEEAASK